MPDVTGPLVDFVTTQIGSYGLIAVFVLMLLESACIPVPSEAIMLYGGFLVAQGEQELIPVIAAGVLGNLVGSWLAYWVGYAKGRDWALRFHWLHITEARLAKADRFFARWGTWAVLFSRCIPIVRTFISLPAGVARMPFWRFTILTVIGCIPWVTALTLIGRAAGEDWERLQQQLHYVDYLLVLGAGAAFVWWLVKRRGRKTASSAP
jgi:membrane protein DedA with SNARE-associated domain